MKRKLLAKFLTAALVVETVLQGWGAFPVHAAGEIPIDSAHFPDAEFRKIMNQRYDTNHDGYLDERERGVYNVVCEGNKNVKSMEGIEYFPDVRGIWCKDCDLASLDLSQNKEVTGVWCSGNPRIKSLSFRDNPNLEWLYCHDCDLRSLDVTQNDKLAYLEVNTNEYLGTLDVTNNPNLEHLTCGTCGLARLDLSNNPILTHLDAFQNKFTSLDLSHNTQLKRLDIWNNRELGNIDVSIFPDLEFYNCAYNGVTELDVTHNESLMMLICSGNPDLKKLDLTHNHRLAWLRCMSTGISSLNLSQCPQLYFCQVCHNPGLTSLDISNNTRLIKIVQDGEIDYSEYDGMNYDWVINYGGSTDYMDDLRYWFIVDDAWCNVTGVPSQPVGNGDPNYYDCFINTNDGASGDIVTRGEAIQTLYELAGRPGYNGSGASRFNDLDGEFYKAAAIWGAEENIALGYPNVYSDTFAGDKPISKQDLALMVHRYALAYGYDSAYDYGRTDHFKDSLDIDFYAWGAFTYAIQWEIIPTKGDYVYPHGRATATEFQTGLKNFMDHVGISRSVSVCTSGGNGNLTAQDKNTRHYTNHSECFGNSNNGGGSGNNNSNPVNNFNREEATKFVDRMYKVVLGRNADQDGENYWVRELESGRKDAVDIVYGFFYSQEYQNSNKSNNEIVTDCYNAMLGRDPDSSGFDYWVQRLDVGMTPEAILAGFVGSQEFINLCRGYGIDPGTYRTTAARDQNYERTYFVYRLYKNCLGRTPDVGGLENWCGELGRGGSGTKVAYGFVFSQEYLRKHTSNEEYVDMLYRTILGREADSAGRRNWVGQLNRGGSREQVLNGFMQSQEFAEQCRKAGINKGDPIPEP